MKVLVWTLFLGVVTTTFSGGVGAAAGRIIEVHSYLRELVQMSMPLASVVGSPYFRMLFPKAHGAPHWEDYVKQKQTEGKSFEEGLQSYMRMFGSGVGRMSDEEATALLMDAPVYRAHVLAHFVTAILMADQVLEHRAANDVCPNCGQPYPSEPHEIVQHFAKIGEGRSALGLNLIPLIIAIDSDLKMSDVINKLTELNGASFAIPYRQRARDIDGQHHTIEQYLARVNHLRHTKLAAGDLGSLHQRGYDVEMLRELLPHGELASRVFGKSALPRRMSGGRLRVGLLDLAMAVDLTHEPGILLPDFSEDFLRYALKERLSSALFMQLNGQHLPTSALQTIELASGQQDILKSLAIELGVEAKSDDFSNLLTEIEDIINDPQQPASLFQIVQMSRLGFSLDEIRALSYDACDAIIVSDPTNRDDFIVKATARGWFKSFNTRAINEAIASTGALAFFLLDKGYSWEEINPHNRAVLKETLQ